MKKFLMELIYPLVMNALNLLIFGVYLATHTMHLSWVLLLLDVLGIKASIALIKEKESVASSIVALILFLIALLGALYLIFLAVLILIEKLM